MHGRLISEPYRHLNAKLHLQNQAFGAGGGRWAPFVKGICEQFGYKTVLDYGAGKEGLKRFLTEFNIASYDPSVPSIAKEPEPADLVICADVLEHVEPDYLDDVLSHIYRLSLKVTVFVVSVRESTKILPDGRNAHLSVQEPIWWLNRITWLGFKLTQFEIFEQDQSFLLLCRK